MTLTLERIAELRRLEEEATEGPWRAVQDEPQPVPYYRALIAFSGGISIVRDDVCTVPKSEWGPNARLTAALRNEADDLLSYAEANAALRELLADLRQYLDEPEIARIDAALASATTGDR